jgi:Family of unknown function (DUF5947)
MSGGSGLRRFVGQAPAPAARSPEPVVEACEMCGAAAGSEHGHVVDTESRSLLCACRPCYLLFADGSGRFRAVPDRVLTGRWLTPAEWESLGIPVGSAFFLRSDQGVAAFYPSPAGATECLLNLDAWAALGATHPLPAAARPEVEAILVRDGECFLVPVDACYELVGLMRLYWKGFDGGTEAHERIDEFFAGIRARATELPG